MHECIQGACEAGGHTSSFFAFLPLLALSPVCSSDALALRILCMCYILTVTNTMTKKSKVLGSRHTHCMPCQNSVSMLSDHVCLYSWHTQHPTPRTALLTSDYNKKCCRPAFCHSCWQHMSSWQPVTAMALGRPNRLLIYCVTQQNWCCESMQPA